MYLRAGGTLLDFLAPCRNSVQLKPRFFLCLQSAFVGTAQQGNTEAQVNLPLENMCWDFLLAQPIPPRSVSQRWSAFSGSLVGRVGPV